MSGGPCMCGALDCSACYPGHVDHGAHEMTEEELGLLDDERGMRWSRRLGRAMIERARNERWD